MTKNTGHLTMLLLAACGETDSSDASGVGTVPTIETPQLQTIDNVGNDHPFEFNISATNLSAAAANGITFYDGIAEDYDRNGQYGSWIDADKDGQNTRAEVLIAESTAPVTFTSATNRTVATGQWHDPYTGMTFTIASDVDIDHFIPLAEAHRSGASYWSQQEREDFANNIDNEAVLIAVDDSTNQSKSDRDPAEWLPPNASFLVDYVFTWIKLKALYNLFMDKSEYDSVLSQVAQFENFFVFDIEQKGDAYTTDIATVAGISSPLEVEEHSFGAVAIDDNNVVSFAESDHALQNDNVLDYLVLADATTTYYFVS